MISSHSTDLSLSVLIDEQANQGEINDNDTEFPITISHNNALYAFTADLLGVFRGFCNSRDRRKDSMLPPSGPGSCLLAVFVWCIAPGWLL